jgi:HAD superfamily hydrolase (TIGR01549 family)
VSPITSVIFDFHGTLVDEHDAASWLLHSWRRLGRVGTPAEAWGETTTARVVDHLAHIWDHARVIDPHSERDLSYATHRRISREVVLQAVDDVALADALHDTMEGRWEAYADAAATVRLLREGGTRLALLSNIGLDIRPCLRREGLEDLFDVVLLSYEVGLVKPDPAIFELALAELGTTAGQVLMVGDHWAADAGAAQIGIRTLILPPSPGPSSSGLSASEGGASSQGSSVSRGLGLVPRLVLPVERIVCS